MLIDEALAIADRASPVKLGEGLPISPKQGMVFAIYHAAKARREGIGSSDGEVARAVGIARKAGIAQNEIDAALAR
jgi:hypothetical protein